MIAGEALAAWLADPEAQRRSYKGVTDCAAKWSRHPLMTETERALHELGERTPEAVLGVARTFMDRTGDLDALMAELLALSAGDPFFRPPFQPMSSDIHDAFLLYHHPDLSPDPSANRLYRVNGPELTKVELVAVLNVLKPEALYMLFESETETFSEFILQERLTRAYRTLADPRFASRPINVIAFDCGFGDLSHFNRSFRRRFAMTPSEARAEPRKS